MYSRTSSISKSIRGEGTGVKHDAVDTTYDLDSPTDPNDLDSPNNISPLGDEPQHQGLEVPAAEATATSPMSPMSDYHDAQSHVDLESPILSSEPPVEVKS